MTFHWFDEAFHHRRAYKTHQLSFWAGNKACIEEHADTAVVEIKRGMFTSRLEFAWPSERVKVADLERMFEEVFESGRRDAKREVRKVLEIVQPRS